MWRNNNYHQQQECIILNRFITKVELATLSEHLATLWQFHILSRKKNMELEGTCC